MKRRLGWELKTCKHCFLHIITVNNYFLEFSILGKIRDRETVYGKAINIIENLIVGDTEDMLKDIKAKHFSLPGDKK